MFKRKASAVWNGDGATGRGRLSLGSGTLKDTPYTFKMRFGDDPGTNPEELIAAAHAGCYNMAFAFGLAGAGFKADELATTATVSFVTEGTPTISTITLDVVAKVPGIANDKFLELANAAKAGCPVSRALNAEIVLNARLA